MSRIVLEQRRATGRQHRAILLRIVVAALLAAIVTAALHLGLAD